MEQQKLKAFVWSVGLRGDQPLVALVLATDAGTAWKIASEAYTTFGLMSGEVAPISQTVRTEAIEQVVQMVSVYLNMVPQTKRDILLANMKVLVQSEMNGWIASDRLASQLKTIAREPTEERLASARTMFLVLLATTIV